MDGNEGWDPFLIRRSVTTQVCLTPKLSGAPRRNYWQFIHGASAQTHVRRPCEVPQNAKTYFEPAAASILSQH